MIKKTLCTVFSAMFLFVSIPTFAASSKYQKESKHFILDIEDKYFDGNISPEKLSEWLRKLDASYEALEDLYGKPESTKKIRIKSATLDSYTSFSYDKANDGIAPLVKWCNDNRDNCVRSTLKSINRGDEFFESLLFAISDFFTGINRSYAGWSFDRYTFDQLSVDYLAELDNQTQPSDVANGLYDNSPSYTFESMASKLVELKNKIGSWEPFKKVFRAFSSGSIDEIREYLGKCAYRSDEMHCVYDYGPSHLNPLRRFKAFMNELSKQGYVDEVNNLFTPAQMDAIESYLSPKIRLETERVESNYSHILF